jgi:hypothetical protein
MVAGLGILVVLYPVVSGQWSVVRRASRALTTGH